MPYQRLVRVASSSYEEKHVRDEAFTELVNRFQPMVMFHANRTLGDPHKAEDAAQNTFLEAFRKLNQLQNPLAFPSWLRRIVQTQCHRQLRKQRANLYPIDEAFQIATTDPGPLELVEKRECSDRLAHAVEKLPINERVPTRMFYFERLTHSEIANQLGIPAKTVKSRLHSARGRMRGYLERNSPTLERLARRGQPILQVANNTAESAPRVVTMSSRKSVVSMAA